MRYIYSALFTQENGKYFARIPDLPGCITSGKSLEEAIALVTDAASGWLVVAEDEGLPITSPTPQESLSHNPDDVLSLIQVDTIAYRAATDTRAVRKNVSIPAWMDALASKRGVNCSQVLQDGLRAIFES